MAFETQVVLRQERVDGHIDRLIATMDDEATDLRIEEMYLRGSNAKEIKAELKIGDARLREGLVSIRERWQRQAADQINTRQRLVQEMRQVRRQAWEFIQNAEMRSSDRVHSLKAIIEAVVVEGRLSGLITDSKETGLRDEHVKKIWDALQNKEKSPVIFEAIVREASNGDPSS